MSDATRDGELYQSDRLEPLGRVAARPAADDSRSGLIARARSEDEHSIERALHVARMAVAAIAAAAMVGVRTDQGRIPGGIDVALLILVAAGFSTGILVMLARTRWARLTGLVGEMLDVTGALGLVVVLAGPLGNAAWMILLLPIVMGGVRFGAGGTLLGWALCCCGYLVLILTRSLQATGQDVAHQFAVSLQHLAFLLALAVPVAALTQWLQQRWEHQHRLAVSADIRARRLSQVETLARGLAHVSEAEMLVDPARSVGTLGFTAVTITRHEGDRWAMVAVDGEDIGLPADEAPPLPGAEETIVSEWIGADDPLPLTSVSVALESAGHSGAHALHGWSREPVDDDLALALGLLGGHARVALQVARMLAELQHQASQDPLTGLLNRRAFTERLDALADRESRVALLLLDLDHFKGINDGYGHPAGDSTLRVVTGRLRAAIDGAGVTSQALVARLGGDEFAIVVADAETEAIVAVAELIEQSMAEPVALATASLAVTFSIGIADAAEGSGWQAEHLIAAADAATYQAKSRGRARSCWADGLVIPDELPTSTHDHV